MTLGGAPFNSFCGRWYVTQVRCGTEKATARELSAREVAYFLPLLLHRTRDRDGRRRITASAALPGYIAFCGGDGDRYRVLETGRVVNRNVISILSCALQAQLRNELSALYDALHRNPMAASKLEAWMPARIVRGPYQGMEGIIEPGGRAARVILRVTTLGQSVPIEIDPEDVEPIGFEPTAKQTKRAEHP